MIPCDQNIFSDANHEQRNKMIALAAYYLAEQRGFTPGAAESDWLQAEASIDNLLCNHQVTPTNLRNALIFAK